LGEVGGYIGEKREIFKIPLAWPGTSGTTSDLQPSPDKRLVNKLAVIFLGNPWPVRYLGGDIKQLNFLKFHRQRRAF